MHLLIRSVLLGLAASCATAAPHAVSAAYVQQSQVMLSADNCQPALPAFDGNIRKRPLGMQNEGAATAFVTCAFKGLRFDPRTTGNDLVGIVLSAQGSQSVTVTCTLVTGVGEPNYSTQTRTVYPGVGNLLVWESGALDFAAMSCSLPPQAGILYTVRNYEEYIVD